MIDHERRLKRMHLIYYLRTFNKADGSLIGHLADITVEGVMLVGETPMQPDIEYALTMSLPEEIIGRKQVDFKARCLWSQRDRNPDFYISGCQISEISEDDVDAIRILIDDYAFLD